jgi:hypothetical protein
MNLACVEHNLSRKTIILIKPFSCLRNVMHDHSKFSKFPSLLFTVLERQFSATPPRSYLHYLSLNRVTLRGQ